MYNTPYNYDIPDKFSNTITWLENLSKTINYFTNLDYQLIDNLNWYVENDVSNITWNGYNKFKFFDESKHKEFSLVGSAEQSFLALMQNGEIEENKKYIGFTPCFRNETEFSPLKLECFYKAELFYLLSEYNDTSVKIYTDMISSSVDNFMTLSKSYNDTLSYNIQETNENNTYLSADIAVNGIELGSYGIKNNEKFNWIYGTALAEPRFSRAIQSFITR